MRNAWHFYYALFLVIKVVCGNIVLRCSPLKRALCVLLPVCLIDLRLCMVYCLTFQCFTQERICLILIHMLYFGVLLNRSLT
ncbi:TPA: DUF3265 domain-containing protein [Vibrio parahaemolyticus]|nr:DUF3265 domain-containing protein [Vibrio parahaemolyticus]